MYKRLALFLLLLAACSGEKTIDTSDEQSMQQSIADVSETLSPDQQAEFEQALTELAFADLDVSELMSKGEDAADDLTDGMKERLAGKTAAEVIAEAKQLRAERERKQRAQALEEIQELLAKQAEAETAKASLAAFEVQRSRFYKQERSFGGDEPVIELTVKNGTDHAVAQAYFEGTLASPGRSVPWLKDTFSYQISGGLEPGESKTWKLAPNMFGDWGSVDAPSDAILTVEVIRLDGADDEPLFDASGLNEYEEKRLAELQSKYGSAE